MSAEKIMQDAIEKIRALEADNEALKDLRDDLVCNCNAIRKERDEARAENKDQKDRNLRLTDENERLLAELKSSRAPEVGEVVAVGWIVKSDLELSPQYLEGIMVYQNEFNCADECRENDTKAIPVVITRRVER